MIPHDEIDDLLAESAEKRRRRDRMGRPNKGEETHRRPQIDRTVTLEDGVSIHWLGKAFGIEVSVVRSKLATCPTVGRRGSGFLYRLVDAAPYLVKPKQDVAAYIDAMRPVDLPEQLRKPYWDAKIARQKWEREAKRLWHSDDVMRVFAEVFQAVKFTVQLWPDTVERAEGLTHEQRELLVTLGDSLQDEIYQRVVEMSQGQLTRSSLFSEGAETVSSDPEDEDDGDPDAEDPEDIL